MNYKIWLMLLLAAAALWVSAGEMQAAENVHFFAKVGIDVSSDYSPLGGFGDRFNFAGGADITVGEMFEIGPELLYHRIGVEGHDGINEIDGAVSFRVAPKLSGSIQPYGFGGAGFYHVGDSNGALIQAGGGFRFTTKPQIFIEGAWHHYAGGFATSAGGGYSFVGSNNFVIFGGVRF
ncbi:MAG: hypothetical protein AB1714_21510 [Acidobacteriota bacterium]